MTVTSKTLKNLQSTSLSGALQGSKKTHTIEIDYEDNGVQLLGKVVVHYPSLSEKLYMGVLKSQLLQGLIVDTMTDNIAHISSTLEVVVDYKPDWFNIDNPELPYEVLEGVFIEYLEWVDSFRLDVKKDTNAGTDTDTQQ